jgi:hypothetical protein
MGIFSGVLIEGEKERDDLFALVGLAWFLFFFLALFLYLLSLWTFAHSLAPYVALSFRA